MPPPALPTSNVICPHCNTSTPAGAFCEACGRALPSLVPSGPRVVDGKSLPVTAAGGELLGEELTKTTKRAANTLLAVGIVQIVLGGIQVAAADANRRGGASLNDPAVLVGLAIIGVLGLVFIGLSLWARHSPLPASIVGLILYATLIVLNVVVAMQSIGQADQSNRSVGGLGIGWLDVVILLFLSRGINAALAHRRLMQSQALPLA